MEQKTKIETENGRQNLVITREFELPMELLFKAYVEPEIIEEWMSTKVLKLENKKHGGYRFETTDGKGNKHVFGGVIHDFIPNRKIVRTFEMENMPFGVQLEFLEFEQLGGGDTSLLRMQIVCRSVAAKEQLLRLPFAQGLSTAHNRLQETAARLKERLLRMENEQ